MKETLTAIVVYRGDISDRMPKDTPFRVVDGNTEQSIDVRKGLAAANMSFEAFTEIVESILRKDASKVGTILSIKWNRLAYLE